MILPIIGMSPGNSYFKDREVAYLLRETVKKYSKAAVMVADIPAISTYLAMGYTPIKAKEKAVLKGNNLKNRTRRLLSEIGIEKEEIFVIDRKEEIEHNHKYKQHYETLKKLYIANESFRASVQAASRGVLENAGKEVIEENIEQATHYLLSEIAFLEYAPEFFSMDQIIYVYHKNWRVYEDYIAGVFDGKVRHYLDFLLLESPLETHSSIRVTEKSRLEVVRERKVLRAGFSPYLDYIYPHGKQGILQGPLYDVIQKICGNNGLLFEVVEQTGYGVVSARLNDGYIDAFCSPTRPTRKRRSEMFFSKSLFTSDIYMYMNSYSPYKYHDIRNLKDNKNLRVAVKQNDVHEELAREYLPAARLVRVPQLSNPEEVINFVLENRADLTFWDEKLTEYHLDKRGVSHNTLIKKTIGNEPLVRYENCFALPWGEFELKKLIDKMIDDGFKMFADVTHK